MQPQSLGSWNTYNLVFQQVLLLQYSHLLAHWTLGLPKGSPMFPLYPLLVCAIRNDVVVDNVYT